MIFVVLGTHELPFNRLLEAIEAEIIKHNIQEEVIVQLGHTEFETKYLKLIKFMSYKEMEKLYQDASCIIAHGGTGSITMGVKMGKKVIAAPRLIKYGEHNDDHQLEIVKQFYQAGHILSWTEGMDLGDVLKQIKTFQPVPFKSGRGQILSIIKDFVDGI
ncbi:PssE/Cps14G family polysaccharide biosynthesis glycosyltransferase [Peribacillus sp. JNUCC 23]